MKNQPFVSIVICTHNRAVDLERYALRSIKDLDYSNFEIVVVDDASTDDTAAVVQKHVGQFDRLKYVRNERHRCLCHVRNLGIAHSEGEIVAFTDDDCFLDSNWLAEMVLPYLEDDQVMAVTGQVFSGKSGEPQSAAGCNMSFRSSVFKSVRFDENLRYSHWFDEMELFQQMERLGMRRVEQPSAIVHHYVRPSAFRPDKIGKSLNAIYLYAKQTALWKYYGSILLFSRCFIRYKAGSKYWIERHFSKLGCCQLVGHLKNRPVNRPIVLQWLSVYWLVLIEIPCRAVTRRISDHRMRARNRAH